MPHIKRDKTTNIIVGVIIVIAALLFWLQRDYTTLYGGTFADPIIIVLAFLGLLLIVLALRGRAFGSDAVSGTPIPVKNLIVAIVVLIVWVAVIPYLGYLISGILFYFITALIMQTQRFNVKKIIADLVIAVVVVSAFYYLFTEVLYVRLPKFPF